MRGGQIIAPSSRGVQPLPGACSERDEGCMNPQDVSGTKWTASGQNYSYQYVIDSLKNSQKKLCSGGAFICNQLMSILTLYYVRLTYWHL